MCVRVLRVCAHLHSTSCRIFFYTCIDKLVCLLTIAVGSLMSLYKIRLFYSGKIRLFCFFCYVILTILQGWSYWCFVTVLILNNNKALTLCCFVQLVSLCKSVMPWLTDIISALKCVCFLFALWSSPPKWNLMGILFFYPPEIHIDLNQKFNRGVVRIMRLRQQPWGGIIYCKIGFGGKTCTKHTYTHATQICMHTCVGCFLLCMCIHFCYAYAFLLS